MPRTLAYSANQNNGRIVQQTDNISGEQVTYQYDTLNRLISAVTADNPNVGQWGQAFLYDGFGNLTDKSVIKGSAPVWHGLADPATNRASGYTYDGNGNAGVPYMQYGYDTENRLISQVAWVQSSQYQYGYGYDPDNRRVYKTTGTYDPGSGTYPIVGEEITFWGATGQRMGTYLLMVDPGGNGYAPSLSLRWQNTERVYFGNRLIWGSGPVFTDRLGSIGKYFPYGEERPAATVGDGERFATYFRESATGLDYADQRYYINDTGRFLSPDPSGTVRLADPGTWNRYAYVGGDPVNFNDPSGLLADSVDVPCGPNWINDASLQGPCADGIGLPGISTQQRREWQVTDAIQSLGDLASGWQWANSATTAVSINMSADAFEEAMLPQLAGAGAAGGVIVVTGGPIAWATVGTAVVITGVTLAAVYVINQIIEKSRSQAGQQADYNKALDRLKRECGKTLTPGQRGRVHGQITGQDLTVDEIVDIMKDVAGCSGTGGQGDGGH